MVSHELVHLTRGRSSAGLLQPYSLPLSSQVTSVLVMVCRITGSRFLSNSVWLLVLFTE